MGNPVNAPTPRILLVVDDDPDIYPLIQSMLVGTQWHADYAAGGEEALARLEARTYDVILSDILMPGMDGLTLLGRLRERQSDARIVMMTVYNTPDHVLRSLRKE